MDMNDRLVSGAPSYDGYFAFEHGPQVLAIDGRLTFAALGEVTIDPSRPVQLTAFPSILPAGWAGTQAYESDNLRAEERGDSCSLQRYRAAGCLARIPDVDSRNEERLGTGVNLARASHIAGL
jgi:hypothetical protein